MNGSVPCVNLINVKRNRQEGCIPFGIPSEVPRALLLPAQILILGPEIGP